MTIYQILSLARPALDALLAEGISLKDVQYLELYDDYERMVLQAHKKAYIEAVLCEKHGVGRAKFYKIIRSFQTEVG